MTMRVAMVDPSLFTGRYDDSLCAALVQAGAKVDLLGRPMRGTDAIRPRSYAYHPRFFALSERLRRMLGEGAAFRGLKAAEYAVDAAVRPLGGMARAEVIHWQWLPLPQADALFLARLARHPARPALVHTVHNASAYHGDGGAQGRGYRALLERFDRLIVHGEETRQALLAEGVASGRIAIVPHPPMELARASAADEAAVAQKRLPRLLFFGTIRPYKGFDTLIDACIAAWRNGVAFELAVAGKPFMDIAPLVARVEAAGFGERLLADFAFLKEERLDAHLRAADMIVFPYRHIDSSGAFLSALHYGKAMLCTRVGMFGALPEIDGAPAASLVPPDDASALAGAITELARDARLRDAMGQRALALRARLCDWGEAARRTLAVYYEARKEAEGR